MTPAYNCLTFDTTLNAELLDSLLDVNTTLTLGTALIHSALLLTLAFNLTLASHPYESLLDYHQTRVSLIVDRAFIHSFICPCSPRTAVFRVFTNHLDFYLVIYLLDPTDRRSVSRILTKLVTLPY